MYRPFVPIALAYGDQTTFQLTGLIDTGADSVLVSDYLAEQLGVDLRTLVCQRALGIVDRCRYQTGISLHSWENSRT